MSEKKTWTIGRSEAADISVTASAVSSIHARLSWEAGEWTLEDLGSTNGTFVDGKRLEPHVPVSVSPRCHITLSSQVVMPWPKAPGASQRQDSEQDVNIRIGRAPDNDHVVDFPMVSWHHAHIFAQDGQYVLEDLSSRNGTAINRAENRITRAAVQPSDQIFLGSYKIPASKFLGGGRSVVGEAAGTPVAFRGNEVVIGRDPACDQPLDFPAISWQHARLTRSADGLWVEDLGSRNGTFLNGVRITARTHAEAGDQIALGSFRFQLQQDGRLLRREYFGNVTIEANGITVAANGKRLLDPVSFTIYPSELVALMGPAGAGKTTLLKALNGYTLPEQGTVLFNGSDLYASYDLFRLQMGYVPQDDIVHSQLTVFEALQYSLQLRTDLSPAEIETRIDNVLTKLGIHDRKKTVIGSPERKVLSGGQRKRVNIALELVHDTPVLFLDEPTSGLSSQDAEEVVLELKRLSQAGKTVIATIHQPSTQMFRQFDNLLMVKRDKDAADAVGALTYFGPAYPDSILFFNQQPASAGAKQPESTLIPDMLFTGMDQANTPRWIERYRESPYYRQFVRDRAGTQPVDTKALPPTPVQRPVDLRQWWALTRRNALCRWRDRAQAAILFVQAPLFAALIVAVIGHLTNVRGDELTRKLGILSFLTVVAATWFGCNNAARDIVGEWTIYQRERMVSLKLPSYVFSKLAVLTTINVFQCAVMLAMVHAGCNLHGRFWVEGLFLLMAALIGSGIGLCISARAATTESAIALLPVVLLPVVALGGGLQPTFKLPRVVQGLTYVIPSRWAFESNLVEEATHWPLNPPVPRQPAVPGMPVSPQQRCLSPAELQVQQTVSTDAAQLPVPTFYMPRNGECSARPVAQNIDGAIAFRHPLRFSLALLAGMLVALVSLALTFLRIRDTR